MPKRAASPRVGSDERIRVSVELDAELADKIDEIIVKLRPFVGEVSTSSVIRAALELFHRDGDWQSAKYA